MLSSAAEHLFWMARSMERAENTARMLDITYRMSLMKSGSQSPWNQWAAMLAISGLDEDFARRGLAVDSADVMHFMTLDESNPSSIFSCIYNARENARAERGIISSEMWESLNHTWLAMRDTRARGIPADGVSSFFDWVKERSHLLRGITLGTLLRGDPFNFIRLGTFLERGDNTARILDVKYHVLLPSTSGVGSAADYYQWGALLRSVSAFEAYRKVYRDVITPRRVAELLILNRDMPRSLFACMDEVDHVARDLEGPRGTALRRHVGKLRSELEFGQIGDIFKQGLHEYLESTLERINEIGDEVSRTYFWLTDD